MDANGKGRYVCRYSACYWHRRQYLRTIAKLDGAGVARISNDRAQTYALGSDGRIERTGQGYRRSLIADLSDKNCSRCRLSSVDLRCAGLISRDISGAVRIEREASSPAEVDDDRVQKAISIARYLH